MQPIAHRVGEAGQLDAVRAHDADAAELQAVGEIEDGAAVQQRRESVLGRQRRCARRQGASRPRRARPGGR